MGRRLQWIVAVLSAAFVAAGCGGGSNGEVLTVKGMADATRAAKTARFLATAGPGSVSAGAPRILGEADFASRRYRTHWNLSHVKGWPFAAKNGLDMIIVANHQYDRGLIGSGWCEEVGTKPTDPRQAFGVDPTAALGSLHPPETLERLGVAVVRGVTTTRYRVLHGPTPTEDTPSPSEVWVDSQDRVMRVTEHLDNGEHNGSYYSVVVEFYDFGAPLTPITAPVASTSC